MKNNIFSQFKIYGKQLKPATIIWIARNVAPLVWNKIDNYMASNNKTSITFDEAVWLIKRDDDVLRLLDHALSNEPIPNTENDVGFWQALAVIVPAVTQLATSLFGHKGGEQQQGGNQPGSSQSTQNWLNQFLLLQQQQAAQQQRMFQQMLMYGAVGVGGIVIMVVLYMMLKAVFKRKPKRRVVRRIIREAQ